MDMVVPPRLSVDRPLRTTNPWLSPSRIPASVLRITCIRCRRCWTVAWLRAAIASRMALCNSRNQENFLRKYYKQMPRTMLRYAIERFPEPKRQAYLQGTIKDLDLSKQL